MDPTRDNILIRFKAFIDGLGIFTFFGLILVILVGGGMLVKLIGKPKSPEDPAAEVRYKNKAEIEKAQAASLPMEQIDSVMDQVAEKLAGSKPVPVEAENQLVPVIDDGSAAAAAPIDPAVMDAGKAQYAMCAACHGQNGEGGPIAPPLAGSEWVTGPVSNLILIQLRGLAGPITVAGKEYNFPAGMIPMNYQTDEQIANVLTYVRNSFGNKASAVKPEEVLEKRGEVGKPQLSVQDLIKP